MGVVYKVKPEVRDFILEQKNSTPSLSCRKLTALVLDNFKVEISKSSINSIIKEAGLSAPVGRTPKKKRRHIAMPNLPVLLEGASSQEITEAVKPKEEPSLKIEEEKPKEEELKSKQLEEEKIKLAQEAEQKAREEKDKELLRRQTQESLAEEEAQRIKLAQLEEERRLKAEAARKEEEEKRKAEEEAAARAEEEKKKKEEERFSAAFSAGKTYQIENSGIILLKAADFIVGASKQIAAAIKSRLPQEQGNLEDLVESLLYLPLLKDKIGQEAMNNLSGHLERIEGVKVMNLDISRTISTSLQEARCVKIILSDGNSLYLDASLYSVWSSPHIPYDFAAPLNSLKKRVNKYFSEDSPFIIFNAPGYDMPSQEFFNFLLGLDGTEFNITSMVLYGNRLEELETLPLSFFQKRNYIFGVWPWQFTECRKVKSIGEFRPFRLQGQGRDLYIADIEMDIKQPNTGKQIAFYGCVVKTSLKEKTRLVILSNFMPGLKQPEELASMYLGHWPNLEEAFQDYSRKIELFTYTANSQRYFSTEGIRLGLGEVASVKDLLGLYLLALDAYVRWHLLPAGYEDKEFGLTKERFYNLLLELKEMDGGCLGNFVLPPAYLFDKDLGYLCRRINEKEAVLSGGRRLYLKAD